VYYVLTRYLFCGIAAALALFNEGVVNPTPDGEVELDFGAVTMEALIRVDTYIRQQKGLPPREYPSANPAAAAAPPPPPVAQQPAAAAAAAPRPPPRQAAAATGRKRGARVIDDVSNSGSGMGCTSCNVKGHYLQWQWQH
jgi:hypothetical protein